MLPSGLPELVADEEDLARFVTSSGQFNTIGVKLDAFMPGRDNETSVFRHSGQPRDELWAIGEEFAAQGRTIHGAAILKARDVRQARLDVLAEEPPPRHAAIRNWPSMEPNPALQKARHKFLAKILSEHSTLLKRS